MLNVAAWSQVGDQEGLAVAWVDADIPSKLLRNLSLGVLLADSKVADSEEVLAVVEDFVAASVEIEAASEDEAASATKAEVGSVDDKDTRMDLPLPMLLADQVGEAATAEDTRIDEMVMAAEINVAEPVATKTRLADEIVGMTSVTETEIETATATVTDSVVADEKTTMDRGSDTTTTTGMMTQGSGEGIDTRILHQVYCVHRFSSHHGFVGGYSTFSVLFQPILGGSDKPLPILSHAMVRSH